MNNVCIIGRFTADPELRHTTSDKAVTSFTIAVNRYNNQTDFIDCVAWNKTAEFISKYFSKGNMIAVTGELQTRSFEDKNGSKRKAVEVNVLSADFCESKKREPDIEVDYKEKAREEFAFKKTEDFEDVSVNDSDLPF